MPFASAHEECADVHFVYGFCNGISWAAVVEYQQHLPNRRVASRNVVYNVRIILRQTCSFPQAYSEREELQRDREGDAVQRSPHPSVCRITAESGIPRSQVWRNLRDDGI